MGEKILGKRRRLHFLTIHPYSVPTTEGKVNIVEVGNSPRQIVNGFFNHLVSKPHYCIGFCNEKWLTRTDIFKDGNSKDIMLCEYLDASLGCDYCLVCADGIVGTVEQSYQGHWLDDNKTLNNSIMEFIKFDKNNRAQNDSGTSGTDESNSNDEQNEGSSSCSSESKRKKEKSVGYSIEVESQSISTSVEADAITLLLIPKHPGVKITFFHIEEDKFRKKYRSHGYSNMQENISVSAEEFNDVISLPAEERLKALLFFDTSQDEKFTTAFLNAAISRENQKLALGGGLVESLNQVGLRPTQQGSLGIAISGSNVATASVLIPSTVTKPKFLERYMKELKSCGLPETQSMAFFFSCCGRGKLWYQQRGDNANDYTNVETKAFKKVFPNTPIFGFFGAGEIGISFLPNFGNDEDLTEGTQQKKRKKKFFHQFTTIIVLLSFL